MTSVVALFVFLGVFDMRKVDNLGRIVIPKELRTKHGLTEGVDITFEDLGVGILVKACDGLCRFRGNMTEGESEIPLCEECIEKILRKHGKAAKALT